jgi:hypothetical protein
MLHQVVLCVIPEVQKFTFLKKLAEGFSIATNITEP